jgi:murein L,D-transpeptidase YafK
MFTVSLLIMLVLAMLTAPAWRPILIRDDATLISLERNERYLKAAWGIPLPGTPDLANLNERLSSIGVTLGAPVLVRIFKREFELEMWLAREGRFEHFATYPICRWSGTLGPKLVQGDRQAPEGFYQVDAGALNPNSRWFRSFNLGYPNIFDRAHNRTGSLIMVHGGCGSVGCFAMTNPQIAEIWQLVTTALSAGQQRFQVQVFPFRMSEARLAGYAGHPALPFWQSLKTGYDLFEAGHLPPRVSVCRGGYRFEAGRAVDDGDIPMLDRCPADAAKS